MRDTITRQELQTAFKALELDPIVVEKITAMTETVQSLEITEEVKLCRGLTQQDTGKDVHLNNRRITGTLHDFNEDDNGDFWLSIDFKIHKFKSDSIVILTKTYRGAETLIDG